MATDNRLSELESIIERGLKDFARTGAALEEVREKKLYRAHYKTFDDYCQDRWGMTRSYADRLILSSRTVANLTPTGVTPALYVEPASESQIRPLTNLPTPVQQQVWQKAVEDAGGKQPTAADIDVLAAEARAALGPQGLARLIQSEEAAALTRARLAKVVDEDTQREKRRKRCQEFIGRAIKNAAEMPSVLHYLKIALEWADSDDCYSPMDEDAIEEIEVA